MWQSDDLTECELKPLAKAFHVKQALSCKDEVEDSGSRKVQHCLDVISHIFECRFLLTMVQTKNSSDLERAPGARSFAAYFFA